MRTKFIHGIHTGVIIPIKNSVQMFKILTVFFLLVLGGFTLQDSTFTLVISIPASSSFLTTDDLGNSYLINGSILQKYDAGGTLLKNFSSKNLGTISFIDANDPLKILVFYESFQQIIFLDNMLVPYSDPISLNALGYNRASIACSSHNNGFWIYDQQNSELIRFDQNLQKSQQTGNIPQLYGSEINPNFITEQNGKVFLNDSAKGILVFDLYGTYNKTIFLKGLNRLQTNNDELIYFKDNKLKSYNLKTLEEHTLSLPAIDVLDARTEKEKLYLLKQRSIDIYSILK